MIWGKMKKDHKFVEKFNLEERLPSIDFKPINNL